MKHLLRNDNFVRLWLGQFLSGVATILFDVGVMVTIFEETGSALQTAVVTVAATLPPFLLGPMAGAVVDRYPRRTVLMVMDIGRALLVASLLLIIQTNAPNVWVLYLIVMGLAAAMTLHQPARSAIIPELVPRQHIVTANSLILSTTPLYYAIGYLLGGALVLLISFRAFIVLAVGLFVAAAVLEMMIRAGERGAGEQRSGAFYAGRITFHIDRHCKGGATRAIVSHAPTSLLRVASPLLTGGR